MVLGIFMTILGAALLVIGFIGSIVPAIPGPIVGYISIILISIPAGFDNLHIAVIIILGIAALGATIFDNILPAMSSKKAGAGKPGVWGSVVGMLAGSFIFPPFGVIIGAFVGALLGEIIFNRENKRPVKAALGVFRGTLFAILLKLSVVGITAYYFVRGAIRMFSMV